MSELKIGLIGLDTSHVTAFTQLLNDPASGTTGGRIVAGYPGGSPDFELSANRVEGFTATLRDQYGVEIFDSPEAVAEKVDAILLTSVDGRVHLEQFKKIAPTGKPVFIDKPFAVTSGDARAIFAVAQEHKVRMFSASSLRYADTLVAAIADSEGGEIIGADTYGPMAIVATQPGLFWYGIHSVDMLYAILGKGCKEVRTVSNDDFDVVTALWHDGRVGTVRGNRKGNHFFGGLIHRTGATQFVDGSNTTKPGYLSLMEMALPMFQGGPAPIDPEETIEVIRFIEAANESREMGKVVAL